MLLRELNLPSLIARSTICAQARASEAALWWFRAIPSFLHTSGNFVGKMSQDFRASSTVQIKGIIGEAIS